MIHTNNATNGAKPVSIDSEGGDTSYEQCEAKFSYTTPLFLYAEHKEKSANFNYISYQQLIETPPSIGPKLDAALFAPHNGPNKRKDGAEVGMYSMLILDHDNDDLTREQIEATYSGVTMDAFTSSYHLQVDDAHPVCQNRWKVLIPLLYPIPADEYLKLCVGTMLRLGTDPAQARLNQICFMPNKLHKDAPFDRASSQGPILDPTDHDHPFIKAALEEWGKDEARKLREAKNAPLNTKGTFEGDSIISMVNDAYDVRTVLLNYGYSPKECFGGYDFSRLIAPNSSSGIPGVVVLKGDDGKDRCYSHHSANSDPLADKKAHDAFDVLCLFEFGGDVGKAVAHYASELDPEGQKQRQRDYMANKDSPQLPMSMTKLPKVSDIDINKPPGIIGDICEYMRATARRELPEVYPVAALQLAALTQKDEKLNFISLAIALTAAGKEHTQNIVKSLARKLFLSLHVQSDPASHKDIINSLVDSDGRMLLVIDEVHSLFNSMKSNKAASYETKIEAELLKLTTTELYTFRGIDKRDLLKSIKKEIEGLIKKRQELEENGEDLEAVDKRFNSAIKHLDYIEQGWPNPFLSIMGHSVPERLDQFASDSENIASGFIGRSLVIRCNETRNRLKRNRLESGGREELNLQDRLENAMKFNDKIQFASEAETVFFAYEDYYEADAQLNDPDLGGIYARATEQLFKVCKLLAIETRCVSAEDVHYAHALVQSSIDNIRYLIVKARAARDGAAERDVMNEARHRIHRECKGGGKARSQIERSVTRNKQWAAMQEKNLSRNLLEEVLVLMLEKGELVLKQESKKKRYLSA